MAASNAHRPCILVCYTRFLSYTRDLATAVSVNCEFISEWLFDISLMHNWHSRSVFHNFSAYLWRWKELYLPNFPSVRCLQNIQIPAWLQMSLLILCYCCVSQKSSSYFAVLSHFTHLYFARLFTLSMVALPVSGKDRGCILCAEQ